MEKLHIKTTGRFFIYLACLLMAISLMVFGSGRLRNRVNQVPVAMDMHLDMGSAIAYNIDLDMDKARVEKTAEHYGEDVKAIAEDAIENNVNNPKAKPTAENTTREQSDLTKALPESLGESFSKADLEDM